MSLRTDITTDDLAGQTLWRTPNINAPINNAPTVVNGMLLVGSRDGKLRAYGLP